MKSPRVVLAAMVVYALCVVYLLILRTASAHHAPDHRIVAIGVETQMIATVMVCDTQDAADSIVTAHRERGLKAAYQVITVLRATPSPTHANEGLCGATQGHMTVHEQYSANIFPEGVIYLVRMTMRESPGRVFFGLITVDDILPADRAAELTADPT